MTAVVSADEGAQDCASITNVEFQTMHFRKDGCFYSIEICESHLYFQGDLQELAMNCPAQFQCGEYFGDSMKRAFVRQAGKLLSVSSGLKRSKQDGAWFHRSDFGNSMEAPHASVPGDHRIRCRWREVLMQPFDPGTASDIA
jgi:hypothetical protein